MASSLVWADEGMWLYNSFPTQKVKAKYGFEANQAWLDHIRLSSVHFANGGSGSFVSPDGLIVTAHHVAADCVQELSGGANDYMKNGFYAATHDKELKCPDLAIDVAIEITDVTPRVNVDVKPGSPATDVLQAQRAAIAEIEKGCGAPPDIHCDVVPLYSGAVYELYRYRRYSDVRIVFVPEFDIAFFGGDPDNYTYPRYDLDVAFLRAYENDKPAHIDHFLRWSHAGAKENELIFVSGSPGATNRWKTVAQLTFLRDVDYPVRIESQKRWIDVLSKFAAESDEHERVSKEYVYGAKNGFKAFVGYEAGLRDARLMATKAAQESKLRAAYSTKNPGASDPWNRIAAAMQAQSEIYKPLTYLERQRGFATQFTRYARTLVRVAAERGKPDDQRLREYRESALPGIKQRLSAAAPLNRDLETVVFIEGLEQMQLAMGSGAMKFLDGQSIEAYAKAAIEDSKLDDPAVRMRLYEGGEAAIEASTDPIIVLMRSIDPEARAARKRYDDEVESVERSESPKIAKAIFAAYGYAAPPDATSTLRISYGTVRGLTINGKSAPYRTTLEGVFRHAAERGNVAPYQLPASWVNAKSKLDLRTPLDFASTADVIGGNSGSPVVNRAGEIVGIVFDANMPALSSNFVYSDDEGRAVSVDVRAVEETLKQVYGGDNVLSELDAASRDTMPVHKP